jgi:hypothetical protein
VRLDHLLSKETSISEKLVVTILGQTSGENGLSEGHVV